ncbi:acyltransferase family protein [Hymenobacter chitinivorans]|uniref:Peptidoglycan/LPS O-acetylase OafA/YrhL n=1 Tax=Hymenobacter chitinivorans DSM 11115 TaxID=1121954 RepID=A0A2M9BPY9_9BACT|nr:acyltransferase [Hymenobacter chitinivorans]PJJ60021.1 peptidoglycan/LPS O-acetylase OafA/YrhL [Hymenobacter chitinivorans DSM 11115]
MESSPVLTAAPVTPLGTKPHYAILDGLRGVAALTVVAFHLCEPHATSHLDQVINHGYLAVDFFFLLSGFVIGYAYDDRWGRMTLKEFFRARLVRLQPMVVLGMVVGALCFYFQASPVWPGIAGVPVWKMLLVMLVGFTLLPLPVSLDIRGWHEMHPLNGPGWSLFYEYVANLLYALGVRKFSNTALGILVALAGAALIHLAVTSQAGDVIGGWSLDPEQLRIGFSRVLFPFFAGLLLSRVAPLARFTSVFLLCSGLLLLVLAFPRVGGAEQVWLNGLYDSLSIVVVFPLIVWLGASGQIAGARSARLCKFLGDISYPIYMTHFPLIYIYTGWVVAHKPPLGQAVLVAVLVFVTAVGLAYASLKLYDEPVRRWLKTRFMERRAA